MMRALATAGSSYTGSWAFLASSASPAYLLPLASILNRYKLIIIYPYQDLLDGRRRVQK